MYDMANIKKLPVLGAKAPDAWKAFVAFDKGVRPGSTITSALRLPLSIRDA